MLIWGSGYIEKRNNTNGIILLMSQYYKLNQILHYWICFLELNLFYFNTEIIN
jgi:hypothetical protein